AMDAHEPSRRLSPLARWAWAAQQLGAWGVALFVSTQVADAVDELSPLPFAIFAGLVICVVAIPTLRWRRWRSDMRDDGLDIPHGTFTVRRTLVPWIRVQHVDTRRGALEQMFGLATVVVH